MQPETDYREYVLDRAVASGKFPEARREHYRQMYNRDPAGTTRLIDTLAPGLPPAPSAATGTAGNGDDVLAAARATFPELARRQRREGRSSAFAGAPVQAQVTVGEASQPPPAPDAVAASISPDTIARMFPEVVARRGPPGRVTRADD